MDSWRKKKAAEMYMVMVDLVVTKNVTALKTLKD
uniref:Uncharacterized protein n=1 Tax=Arundo donax TaxID=35708 RepID=A0A0A8ZKE4_ARUDO